MKTAILAFLLLTIPVSIFAQWEWQNPLPPGNDFISVKFLNETTGFTVGDEAMLLKTTDGGNSWIMKDVGQFSYLVDIEFINQNIGWVLDYYNGYIFKTTDQGETWFLASQIENFSGSDFFFVDSITGWVVGDYKILKTNDGGISWSQQFYNSDYYFNSIFFVDDQIGWATAYNINTFFEREILKTTNGGNSWDIYPQPNIPDISSFYFLNSVNGFAVGTNGGRHHGAFFYYVV